MLSACSGSFPKTAHLGASAAIASNNPAAGSAQNTDIPDPAQSSASPKTLAKLSRKELLARLGRPDFTRRDPPAEIWQYRSAACVLDVFLYPEAGDLHVAHAVTRDPTSMRTNAVACSPFPAGDRLAAAG